MKNLKELQIRERINALSCCEIQNWKFHKFYTTDTIKKDAKFCACSISKLFAVIAVLQAYETGLINIKEVINLYLKDWQLSGESVTIEQCLTYQSGLEDSDGDYGTYDTAFGKPALSDLLNGRTPYIKKKITVKHKPGKAFIYSDNNTLLLEKLLEDIYNLKYRNIIKDKILNPLNMMNSKYLDYADLDHENIVFGMGEKGKWISREKNLYPYDSVANLWTTSQDLSLLLNELMMSFNGTSEKLLKQATVKEMMRPHGAVDFTGYGVFVYERKGKQVFYTQGWGEGFQSYFISLPENGDGIVVMMNRNPGVEQLEGPIGEIVREFINRVGG